jgi:hypothetical protein
MNDILTEPYELDDADLDRVVGGVTLSGGLSITLGGGINQILILLSKTTYGLLNNLLKNISISIHL